jgi:hypothetical protein
MLLQVAAESSASRCEVCLSVPPALPVGRGWNFSKQDGAARRFSQIKEMPASVMRRLDADPDVERDGLAVALGCD